MSMSHDLRFLARRGLFACSAGVLALAGALGVPAAAGATPALHPSRGVPATGARSLRVTAAPSRPRAGRAAPAIGFTGTTESTASLSAADLLPSGPAGEPVAGDLVTLAVTITDASGEATLNPTGLVQILFVVPGGSLVQVCDVPLAPVSGSSPLASSGSCQVSLTDAGTDTYNAEYSGDAVYATSNVASALVSGVDSETRATVTAPGAGAATPAVGGTLALVADVVAVSPEAGGAPGGDVVFLDNGAVISGCSLVALDQGASAAAASTAACSFVVTAAENAISVSYAGDASDGPSTSQPLVQAATPASPSIAVSLSSTLLHAGDTVTVEATLSGPAAVTPTEAIEVTVRVGTHPAQALVCGDELSAGAGIATCDYTITSTEPLKFGASYPGDAGYSSASATPVTAHPALATPVVSIATAALSPTAGTSDAVTISVTGSAAVGAPRGKITVADPLAQLSACSAVSTVGVTESVTCPLSYVAAGVQVITAHVAGTVNYAAVSASQSVRIGAAQPSIAVAAASAAVGASVAVTATVTGVTGVASPSGSVYIYADGAELRGCKTTTTGGTERGTCEYEYSSTAAVTFTATSAADANYASAVASPLVLTASRAAPRATLATYTPQPEVGSSLEIVASVAVPAGAARPSGLVRFEASTGGSAAFVPIAICGEDSFVGLTLAGTGGCAVVVKSATENFRVIYQGDADYGSTTSNTLAPTILRAAVTMALSKEVSSSPPTPGTFVHILAFVDGVAAVGFPTGTLSISGPRGSHCEFSCTGNPLHHHIRAVSDTQFAIAFPAAGLVTVTVRYGGSSVYAPVSLALSTVITSGPSKVSVAETGPPHPRPGTFVHLVATVAGADTAGPPGRTLSLAGRRARSARLRAQGIA